MVHGNATILWFLWFLGLSIFMFLTSVPPLRRWFIFVSTNLHYTTRNLTRMHSSRMRIGRSLTVFCSIWWRGSAQPPLIQTQPPMQIAVLDVEAPLDADPHPKKNYPGVKICNIYPKNVTFTTKCVTFIMVLNHDKLKTWLNWNMGGGPSQE